MQLRFNAAILSIAFASLLSASGRAATGSEASSRGYVLPDGSIQVVAYGDMVGITERIASLYSQAHPGTKFAIRAANNLAALQCLVYDSSAFAPVATDALGGASVAYGAIIKAEPFLIRIAHASLTPGAKISPLAMVVNPSNPIASISVDQVARIFTETVRKSNFTHWGQIGVTGVLSSREIHPFGLSWSDHLPSDEPEFADFVFLKKLGGGPPVPNYSMSVSYADVVREVASDPQAIGIVALNQITPGVKVLGLVASVWSKPAMGTAEDIETGRYAFDRYIYIFVRRIPGQPIDPLVNEYLHFALSKDGQSAIAADTKGYLPLNPVEVGEELAKLQ